MAKSKSTEAALRERICELEEELKAERAGREQDRAVMTDHLCSIGLRERCAHCHEPVWWVHQHGTGTVILLNCDGTEHWPRCARTPKQQPTFRKPPSAAASLEKRPPILIGRCDAQQTCTYLNAECLDFLGWPLEYACLHWLEAVHPDERCYVARTFNENFAAQQDFAMVFRLRHVSGEYRWIASITIRCDRPDGTFDGMVGYTVEISAIGKIAAAAAA